MSLGRDISAALPALRVEAESMMVSEGFIERPNGAETDPETLEERPIYVRIYTGKGRLRMPSTTTPNVDSIPGQTAVNERATLSIPVEAAGSADVRPNDVWEFTTNPFDTGTVGRRYRITGTHVQTFATARRFAVEELL